MHNHFVVNAVNSMDGKKLQTDHDFIRRMREENDRICKVHNLSVIEAPTNSGKSYAEWVIAHNGGFTWRGMIRHDIDELIPRVTTFKELLKELECNGYTVNRRGKYLSLSPPGAKVNFRLYKLGNGYTEEDIAERIMYSDRRLAKESKAKPFRVRVKAYHLKSTFPIRSQGKLRGLYYVYLYRLRKLLNSSTYSNVPIQARHDTKLFKEFTEDATLLFDSKIDTVEQLLNLYYQLDEKRHKLCVKRLSLRKELTYCDSVDVAKGIQSQITELNPLIERLGNQMRSCERIYERSARVSDTNREISVEQSEVIKSENVKPQNNNTEKTQKMKGMMIMSAEAEATDILVRMTMEGIQYCFRFTGEAASKGIALFSLGCVHSMTASPANRSSAVRLRHELFLTILSAVRFFPYLKPI